MPPESWSKLRTAIFILCGAAEGHRILADPRDDIREIVEFNPPSLVETTRSGHEAAGRYRWKSLAALLGIRPIAAAFGHRASLLSDRRLLARPRLRFAPGNAAARSHPLVAAELLAIEPGERTNKKRRKKGPPKKAPPPRIPETFAELGCSPDLCDSLKLIGAHKPMEIQRLSWKHLHDTYEDVGMISEAGTGKTLSYLAPLVDQHLALPETESATIHVVVPTHDLTRQVMRVATALCEYTRFEVFAATDPILNTNKRGLQLIVGTGAESEKLLSGSRAGLPGASKAAGAGPKRLRKGQKQDESKSPTSRDLDRRDPRGGRGRDRDSFSDPLRDPYRDPLGARDPLLARDPLQNPEVASFFAAPLSSSEEELDSKETEASAYAKKRRMTMVFDEADFLLAGVRASGKKRLAAHASRILEKLRPSSKRKADLKAMAEKGVVEKLTEEAESTLEGPSKEDVKREVNDAIKMPRVVFVSATIPGEGSSTVGSYIHSRFPDLTWFRSAGAHRPVANLEGEFLIVEDADRTDALVELCEKRDGRTIVFANSASRAKSAHGILTEAGLEAGLFSPDVPLPLREAALEDFSESLDGVLVCSGLGARGIDLPDVSLVVEYDLAPNIIEHVHRVGRTARMGKPGRAVSLCPRFATEQQAALVKDVRRCKEFGYKYV